jgi:hypothetical protein
VVYHSQRKVKSAVKFSRRFLKESKSLASLAVWLLYDLNDIEKAEEWCGEKVCWHCGFKTTRLKKMEMHCKRVHPEQSAWNSIPPQSMTDCRELIEHLSAAHQLSARLYDELSARVEHKKKLKLPANVLVMKRKKKSQATNPAFHGDSDERPSVPLLRKV